MSSSFRSRSGTTTMPPSRRLTRSRTPVPTRLCAMVRSLKGLLPQRDTRLKGIVALVNKLAHMDISRREDDLEIQMLFAQVDAVWGRVSRSRFSWDQYSRRAPREMAVAREFADLVRDAVFEAQHYCM